MFGVMRPPLEITLLRSFVALADTGSVSSVARLVGRTQPAVSQQLRRLEAAADRPLFEGDLRHPLLTPQGERLLRHARAVLRMHDEMQEEIAASDLTGPVRLGCPDLYAAFLLPATLRSFRRIHPLVEVTVRCALTRTLVAELSNGQLDLALTTGMPGVESQVGTGTLLRRERLVWMGRSDGAACHRRPLELAVLPEGNLYRDHALHALDRAGIRWRIACESESLAGLQAVALADAAVTVLAQSVSVPDLEDVTVSAALPLLADVPLVLWLRSPGRSDAVDQLAAHVTDAIGRSQLDQSEQ